MSKLTTVCNITTGKLDANAAVLVGKYPFFTCAPTPLAIDTYAFDGDVILLAGNNAAGDFHCQRYSGKFNAYQRTYVITAKEGYDIDYIYYCLMINLRKLKKVSQGSQTKFLTMGILDEFEVEDETIDVQKRMVEVLRLADTKIVNNAAIYNVLENIAKLLYNYYFVQFDFPDENGKPYKSSNGKMVWNQELKRDIPEGWDFGPIGNLLTEREKSIVQVGEAEGHTGNIPFFTSGDKIIMYEQAFTTGNNCFLNTGGNADVKYYIGDAAYSTDTWCITADEYSNYIYLFLDSLRKYLDISFFAGSGLKHLQKDALKAHKIIIPPINIVKRFNEVATNCFTKTSHIKMENHILSQLRDFLLPMLMNGQVTVR